MAVNWRSIFYRPPLTLLATTDPPPFPPENHVIPENLPPPPPTPAPHHKGWRGGGMNNEWSLRKPLPGPGPWHMKGIWLVIGKQYA